MLRPSSGCSNYSTTCPKRSILTSRSTPAHSARQTFERARCAGDRRSIPLRRSSNNQDYCTALHQSWMSRTSDGPRRRSLWPQTMPPQLPVRGAASASTPSTRSPRVRTTCGQNSCDARRLTDKQRRSESFFWTTSPPLAPQNFLASDTHPTIPRPTSTGTLQSNPSAIFNRLNKYCSDFIGKVIAPSLARPRGPFAPKTRCNQLLLMS